MGRNLGPLNIKDSYEGLVQISGSLLTDGSGSLIPNLTVTASYATTAGTAISASYALTSTSASYALTATSASYAESSSADNITLQQVTDNGNTTTNRITAVGFDATLGIGNRNYNNVGITTNIAGQTFTILGGSTTSKLVLKGNGAVNNIITLDEASAVAPIVLSGNTEITANLNVSSSLTASGLNYPSADGTSGQAIVTDAAGNLSFATVTTPTPTLQEVLDAGNSATQDIALIGDISATNITASFASFTSASIGHLTTVSGSAVIIGDEFIILNADTPTARYAGLIVYDSGSGTPATASFEWDGLTDNWIIVEESGDSAVVLTGPTGSRGSEVLPTLNTLQKGGGHHTLIDSSITDDGTLVTINANISASGYVSASSFIGDGSQLTGISLDPFPYTGSAEILGTLKVDGLDNVNNILQINASDIAGGSMLISTWKADVGAGLVDNFRWLNTATQGAKYEITSNRGDALIQMTSPIGSNAIILSTQDLELDATGDVIINADTEINGNLRTGDSTNVLGVNDYGFIIGGRSNSANNADNGIIGGNSNTSNFARSVVIGGSNLSTTKADEVVVPNLYAKGDAIMSGSLEVIGNITSGNSTNVATGDSATAIGGSNNIATGDVSIVAGGQDSIASGFRAGVFAGEANQSTGTNTVVAGGYNNQLGGSYGVIAGGSGHNAAGDGAFIGGGSTNQGTGYRYGIVGATNCNVQSDSAFIGGGDSNTLVSGNFRGGMVGGQNNTINGSGTDNAVILGGNTNTIQSGSSHSGMLAGSNNMVLHSGSAIIGGDSLLTTKHHEVVVPNLTISGSAVGKVGVLTDAAGTSAMDCSLGNFFTLVLPAGTDTEIVPSNIQAGQTINLKVTNNATPGTISFDSAIEFEGGTTFVASTGASEVDVLTFISFDGTSLQCVGVKNFS